MYHTPLSVCALKASSSSAANCLPTARQHSSLLLHAYSSLAGVTSVRQRASRQYCPRTASSHHPVHNVYSSNRLARLASPTDSDCTPRCSLLSGSTGCTQQLLVTTRLSVTSHAHARFSLSARFKQPPCSTRKSHAESNPHFK